MKVLDKNNIEIFNPDYTKGYTLSEQYLVAHHEAVEAVEEVGHYETIATYPNGGKDIAYVVDVERVEARPAYDEYEDILRYIEYTEDELEAILQEANKPTTEDRVEELEAENKRLKLQAETIVEMLDFYESCIVEIAQVLYE